MVRISIVLINWNGLDDTMSCLSSLSRLRCGDHTVEIIVVDNNSTDHVSARSRINREYPAVVYIQNKTNKGFAGGNNTGIRYALDKQSDIVWLLNNDTVVHDNALLSLVSAMNTAAVGIVGSKIFFSSGREYHATRYTQKEKGKVIWYAGGIIDWKNMLTYHRGVDEVDNGQYERVSETDFVSGCSMCIKKEVFQKIGILDESLFMYMEDVDFAIRAKHQGFGVYYVPQSYIWHKNAASTAKPGNELHEYYLTRNRIILALRYATLRTKFAVVRESIRQIVFSPTIRKKACIDGILGLGGNRYIWKKNYQRLQP